MISAAERRYIEDGVLQNLRVDGRACTDFRPLDVEVGVVRTALGSSRVRTSEADVMCCVKGELSRPETDPESGVVEVHVNSGSVVAADGLGGEKEKEAATQQQNSELASQLNGFLQHSLSEDMRALCIVSGSLCWRLHIDVLVVDGRGLLLDICSVAVRAALADTILPAVSLDSTTMGEGEEGDSEEEGVGRSGRRPTGADLPKVEIDERADAGPRLTAGAAGGSAPVCVTAAVLAGSAVWDPSAPEVGCAEALVTIAVDGQGLCLGMRRSGQGVLDASALPSLVQRGCALGKELQSRIQDVLQAQGAGKEAVNPHAMGFMAE
uniref:Ribosomal RNA-processing protein 42 n=1 Tax=Chromera velia CCMP2878 TaxID=1169474 RepID=A0A0G4GCW2_9ALVE|eukprot:Cvel_21340.t1-p1 / transcript=Cvel_21340.t1 / gene=Cvel_21340 / organism=Chromera_velia_CCMP2878 / gene_product=Exosome complex component RRP42, putative / transcript_product=Exosome complex component RRP42, putative / location=Cvel_scaffold1991:14424-17469(-) / protein_length=322 / sequence_SO=supercontig / SO=protein_coding / is_pseudo=false